ncbi:hypothetical protein EYZ11_009931 [Aspergillus tanneri]|uniref:Uncharacterized protein n=1 Tax=Aspergillus tanneri TaxID=1220188 RepID=A0A4S3J6M3_9EURO|nr:hypothetical protein EYZ11_009931 [Aspergillus tanneri]
MPQPAGPKLARFTYQNIYGRDIWPEIPSDLMVQDEYLGAANDTSPEVLQINIETENGNAACANKHAI